MIAKINIKVDSIKQNTETINIKVDLFRFIDIFSSFTSAQKAYNLFWIISKSFIVMNEYISNTITISAVKVRFYFQLTNVCSSFFGTSSGMGHGPVFGDHRDGSTDPLNDEHKETEAD